MIHWIAHYNNDTQLAYFNPDNTHNNYYDIDRDKIIAFSIFKDDKQILVINLDNDSNDPDIGPKQLIWRKRGRISTSGLNQSVYLAGWQRNVKGKSIQSICYITEDGMIVMSGQWQEDRPLMHAPKFQKFELV